MSVSPMGERHSVGGAMIFTFLNVRCSAWNCSRVTSFGLRFRSMPAFSHTALVVRSPMLLNSVLRNDTHRLLSRFQREYGDAKGALTTLELALSLPMKRNETICMLHQ